MRAKLLLGSLLVTRILTLSTAYAGGPLLIFDPSTRTPYAYSGTVSVYTDRGNLGRLNNNTADGIVASSFAEWTAVVTATFSAAVAGDFLSIGLPNITGNNAGLVIGANNGGGIHVIYDDNGSVLAALGAPPGVLGVASPELAIGGTLTESWAVLNGTEVQAGDGGGASFAGVFTHEFGHAINLAHSQLNGAVGFFGDDIGPAGCTPPYGGLPAVSDVETMYPFLDPSPGGVGVEQATIDRLDDIAAVSNVYPAAGWPSNSGTITGTIYASDGSTEILGVNVIARNLASPWTDAISALSGDFTQGGAGPDGLYTFNGLTAAANYVVYVDGIVAGGFSTPPHNVPGGAEEFHNGVLEGSDPTTDDRCASVSLVPAAGSPITADVILNEPFVFFAHDDAFLEVDLPFTFPFCDVAYTSVFINANGHLTFGAGDEDFTPTVGEFLSGPPRISALWADLSPQVGTVTAAEVSGDFLVTFDDVPEFDTTNSNTFTFRLRSDGTYNVEYGVVDASAGIAGRTPGGGAANPGETNLNAAAEPIGGTTVYENFAGGGDTFDMDNVTLSYDGCGDACAANTAPVAACQDVVVLGDSLQCEVVVLASQVDDGSLDPDGGSLTLTLSPAGPYSEGVTPVLLIVTDACGVSDSCQADITVNCPAGPVLEVFPKDIVLISVATGDTTSAPVTITNTGDVAFEISSITGCDSTDFFVDTGGVSTTVAPGDSTMLQVCYVANAPTPGSCDLTIGTTAGDCVVMVSVGQPTDAPEAVDLVDGFVRSGVWPNPFQGATEVLFALAHQTPVRLVVYDAAGRRVRTLLRDDACPAGMHRVGWDGRNERGSRVAAGTYFVRVTTARGSWVSRAVLLR